MVIRIFIGQGPTVIAVALFAIDTAHNFGSEFRSEKASACIT